MTKIARVFVMTAVVVVGAAVAFVFIRYGDVGWWPVGALGIILLISQVVYWAAARFVRTHPRGARLWLEIAIPSAIISLGSLAATLVAWLGADVIKIASAPTGATQPEINQAKAEQAAFGVATGAIAAAITAAWIEPLKSGGITAARIRKRFLKAFAGARGLPEGLEKSLKLPSHAANWSSRSDRKARATEFANYVGEESVADGPTEEQLVEAVGRLAFSYESLKYAASWLIAHNGQEVQTGLWDVHIDSFLVHARRMYDFFEPTNRRSDDVTIHHLLRADVDWDLRVTGEERNRMNKRIAHLTFARDPQVIQWPVPAIADELRAAMERLTELMADQRPSLAARLQEASTRDEPTFQKLIG